jgi:hypothetical protein
MILAYGTLATVGPPAPDLGLPRGTGLDPCAPVNYMHIAFATLLGWLVFAQIPDALGFAGMA